MTREEKVSLLDRLVNEKHITFKEALDLMDITKEAPVYIGTYEYPKATWINPYKDWTPYGDVYCRTNDREGEQFNTF